MSSDSGPYCLVSLDEKDAFEDEFQVYAFIRAKASQGSDPHKVFLDWFEKHNPKDYKHLQDWFDGINQNLHDYLVQRFPIIKSYRCLNDEFDHIEYMTWGECLEYGMPPTIIDYVKGTSMADSDTSKPIGIAINFYNIGESQSVTLFEWHKDDTLGRYEICSLPADFF